MINTNFPKAVSLGTVKRNGMESIKKAGHARITKTTQELRQEDHSEFQVEEY